MHQRIWLGRCKDAGQVGCCLEEYHTGACNDGNMSEEEYEVECITAEKLVQNKRRYRVKWKGWPEEDSTWQSESSLADAKECLQEWKRSRQPGGTVSTWSAPTARHAARSTLAAVAPAVSASSSAWVVPGQYLCRPGTAVNGHIGVQLFALVNRVDPAGPAATAGLQVGDRLLRFGGLHAENHDQLKALDRLTQLSAGNEVSS